MNVPMEMGDEKAKPELFPYEWLISASVRAVINSAALGVGLLYATPPLKRIDENLSAVDGDTVDFQYIVVNPSLLAIIKLSVEDILGQPLTLVSPDVVPTGILNRLQQVRQTGRPQACIERYQIDGAVGEFNQIYLQSGDGVLMLVQDVSYRPLLADERQQQTALLHAINSHVPVANVRTLLIGLISGQAH